MMTELPVVIVNVQRGGPSTGLPTKTEQSDLLAGDVRPQRRVADAGARGEEPGRHVLLRDRGREDRDPLHGAGDPAVATATSRTAREPWPLPNLDDAAAVRRHAPHRSERLLRLRARPRDARARVGRSPARPASSTASAASRRTRSPATSPTRRRTTRSRRTSAPRRSSASRRTSASSTCRGAESGDVLVIGWGGTYGALRQAQQALRGAGQEGQPRAPALAVAARARPREDHPQLQARASSPSSTWASCAWCIRAKFLIDAVGLNKIQGQPFKVARGRSTAIEQAARRARRRSADVDHATPASNA